MKILVTGTVGFIGYHLAKKLLDRGDTVVGVDNINDYYDVNLKYVRLNQLGIDAQAGEAKATHPKSSSGCAPLGAPVNLSRYGNYNCNKLNLLNRVSA